MVVHDQVGHPLQPGNVVSDNDNTNWLIDEIQIRDRGEDPCGYVVGDHNDITDIFPVRYTDGGAMCFGVRFVREVL